jgi:ribosome-binding protein aMBF1 (putative translation factor)
MEYQIIKENGKAKFVVLPIDEFQAILDRLEDASDLRDIREAKEEPLYDQEEAENYIFMNPVKRERLENGWTQKELADKLGVKQSVVAKWERDGAVYRKATRNKLASMFGIGEENFR